MVIPDSQASAPRIAWVDAVRGGCVLAVVLFHFLAVYGPVLPAGPALTVWTRLGAFLAAFRMPLLFVVSGLIVSSRVRSGWSDRRNLARAVSSYYLYVVWLTLYALFALLPLPRPFAEIDSVPEYLRQFLVPATPLWFVFALAVYVVILCSARRVPPSVVLAVLAVVSVASESLFGFDLWVRVPFYLLFFAVGVHLRPWIERQAELASVPRALVAVALFAVLFAIEQVTSVPVLEETIRVARDLAGVLAGVLVVVLACRSSVVRRPLAALGRETLPIYVLHFPLVLLVPLLPLEATAAGVGAFAAPLVGTAAVCLLCIGIERITRRTPARHLFAAPARLTAAVSAHR